MSGALPLYPLTSKVTAMRGVGPAFAEALEGAGITTVKELLWSLPYRYVDRGSLRKIAELDGAWGAEREVVTVQGVLKDIRSTTTRVRRMALTEALLQDGTGTLRLVWFNQSYLARALRPGDRILAFGPVAATRTGLEMRGPAFENLGKGDPEDGLWSRRYLPLYRRLGPLGGRFRQRLVQEALARAAEPGEWLPPELTRGIPDTLSALRLLHQPPDDADAGDLEAHATPAHRRLACEELFAFALGVCIRKAGRMARRGHAVPTSPELRERLRALLPFRLTGAQRTAFKEIVDDLTSGRVMNRLLQGDVGSGKTLVAFLALAMVAETGGQGALLVPTEVLARQHAATFRRLLGDGADRMELLLGPMKAAEKRKALARIASGEASYVVGTHALFQESVAFQRLQLVVVDEQHRFGVRQREAIKEKGLDPHWLVMSATPIPRSLALALFGDLEQSVLDELPPGRQPITTRLVAPDDAEAAWDRVERELEAGRQAFVISPAIDPQDEAKVPLRDIQAMEALLRARFPDAPLAIVHGRLKADELAARMEAFVKGEARLLLATTVVEVGVDVPNATVMVVDHAERFGLSQLHQLRGRVGRGSHRSHFIMLSASETERLRVLTETQDGFRIAQKDLELRGPGEFFGTRQAGLPRFQAADLVRDRLLLQKCREAAEKALARGLGEAQRDWLRQEQARLRLAEIS
ncbi:ATP-dependent DNA helicase RecG [Mesoterricola sediminis]|uniref:Probable DNA 3'-5' helicase RecG n=1 Tax=Mesoterricola sediminis TaxID=2927980 RepID=A0AA48GXR9_9BACT|nr:ATP-dependent DNA helicase RecG [Mesoterricola sediminis]BDU76350.1 ATP-dependent DNA helicase RecG [Mesoterricola sediminis]